MIETPWATPEQIGKLTLPQLLCLSNGHPPHEKRITSAEEFEKVEKEEVEGWR